MRSEQVIITDSDEIALDFTDQKNNAAGNSFALVKKITCSDSDIINISCLIREFVIPYKSNFPICSSFDLGYSPERDLMFQASMMSGKYTGVKKNKALEFSGVIFGALEFTRKGNVYFYTNKEEYKNLLGEEIPDVIKICNQVVCYSREQGEQ